MKLLSLNNKLSNQRWMSKLSERVGKVLKFLPNILEMYTSASIQVKKKILGSIFPEKIIFDGKKCRATLLNPVIALILSYSNKFKENKKGPTPYFTSLSLLVEPEGIEPSS